MGNVLLGVDECTVVLSADREAIGKLEDWQPYAEQMAAEFGKLAGLERIFGERKYLEGTCPQGYAVAYQYGDNPFYFAVAYHPLHPQMGVVAKFSAYSWAAYCQKGNTDIRKFLHAIQSGLYSARLSRADFTADYRDWQLSVDDIYQKLTAKRLEIRDCNGRKNQSTITGHEVDGEAGTFYVGSKKAGTRLFLRVYDKKAEQMGTHGFRYGEALKAASWVRFEAVYKGSYAHQLTDIIMETGEGGMAGLIADKIAEKFRFYDPEKGAYADFSAALLEKAGTGSGRLRLESPRDNDLAASLLHLANGSGLFPALYKCDMVWGGGTSEALLQSLHRVYREKYRPNDDVLLWLKKHKAATGEQPFGEMLGALGAYRCGRAARPLPGQGRGLQDGPC